jgi:hypothetical protein
VGILPHNTCIDERRSYLHAMVSLSFVLKIFFVGR